MWNTLYNFMWIMLLLCLIYTVSFIILKWLIFHLSTSLFFYMAIRKPVVKCGGHNGSLYNVYTGKSCPVTWHKQDAETGIESKSSYLRLNHPSTSLSKLLIKEWKWKLTILRAYHIPVHQIIWQPAT